MAAKRRVSSAEKAAAATSSGTPWRSRIVRLEMVDPTTLKPHPDNPKVHTETQEVMLDGALHAVGWLKVILASIHTRNIVNGHLRQAYAVKNEMPEVPVLWLDITEAEELELLATLDPIRDMANADPGRMRALLADVKAIAPTWDTRSIRPFDPITDTRTGTAPVAHTSYLSLETTEAEEILNAFVAHVRSQYPDLKNPGSRMIAWVRDHDAQFQEKA